VIYTFKNAQVAYLSKPVHSIYQTARPNIGDDYILFMQESVALHRFAEPSVKWAQWAVLLSHIWQLPDSNLRSLFNGNLPQFFQGIQIYTGKSLILGYVRLLLCHETGEMYTGFCWVTTWKTEA
jgi:hypothetical protein